MYKIFYTYILNWVRTHDYIVYELIKTVHVFRNFGPHEKFRDCLRTLFIFFQSFYVKTANEHGISPCIYAKKNIVHHQKILMYVFFPVQVRKQSHEDWTNWVRESGVFLNIYKKKLSFHDFANNLNTMYSTRLEKIFILLSERLASRGIMGVHLSPPLSTSIR